MSDDPQVSRAYQAQKAQFVEIKGFKFAQELDAVVCKHRASAVVTAPSRIVSLKNNDKRTKASEAYWAKRTASVDQQIEKDPNAKATEIARRIRAKEAREYWGQFTTKAESLINEDPEASFAATANRLSEIEKDDYFKNVPKHEQYLSFGLYRKFVGARKKALSKGAAQSHDDPGTR
jgi:hypothetical protein